MYFRIIIALLIAIVSYFLVPFWVYIVISLSTAGYFVVELINSKRKEKTIVLVTFAVIYSILVFLFFLKFYSFIVLMYPPTGLVIAVAISLVISNKGDEVYDLSKRDQNFSYNLSKENTMNTKHQNMIDLALDNNMRSEEDEGTLHGGKIARNENHANDVIAEINEKEQNESNDYRLTRPTNDSDFVRSEIGKLVDEKLNYFSNSIKDEFNVGLLNFKKTLVTSIKSGEIDPYNGRMLCNEEIMDKFIEVLNNAKEEIDIASPWIGSWLFKEDGRMILSGFEKALATGVKIKILYGMASSYGIDKRLVETEKNAVEILRKFNDYGEKIKMKKGNSHEKVLLWDDRYSLVGSYNLLSFRGNYSGRDRRNESMFYSENPDLVKTIREKTFSW